MLRIYLGRTFVPEIRDKNDPVWIKKIGKLILLDFFCRDLVDSLFVSWYKLKIFRFLSEDIIDKKKRREIKFENDIEKNICRGLLLIFLLSEYFYSFHE